MDWIASIALSFELSEGSGVIVLADHARDCHMAALLRALAPSIPDITVCLTPLEISRLPECATVIYRPKPEHAPVLNRMRPFFADQKLRVVLWCSDATTLALMGGAPDFFDWISHRDEIPDALPPFAVASVKLAATAVPGIVWRGPGPLEPVLAAAGETAGARLALGADLAPLIDALRDAPADEWVLVDGIESDDAMFDLRYATAIAGRSKRVAVMGSEGARVLPEGSNAAVGWAPLDDRDTTLPAICEILGESGVAANVTLCAALGGEPGAVASVPFLLGLGLSVEELLRVAIASEDPGVAVATMAIERSAPVFRADRDTTTFRSALIEGGPSAMRRALWQRPERREWQRALRAEVLRELRHGEISRGPALTWWASHNGWFPSPRTLRVDPEAAAVMVEALLRARPEEWPALLRRTPTSPRLASYFDRRRGSAETPEDLQRRADVAFEEGRFAPALDDYRAGLAHPDVDPSEPTYARLCAGAARVLTALGRYDHALASTASELTGHRSIVSHETLRALVRGGRVDEARALVSAIESEDRHDEAAWSTAQMEYDLLIGRWNRPWMNIMIAGAGPGDLDLSVVLGVERQLLTNAAQDTSAECARLLALPTLGSLARARIEHILARASIVSGRYADADAALARALPVLVALLGERHHYVGQLLVTRAELRTRGGRYKEAARDLASAIEIYSETLDADHPDRLVADFTLAMLPDRHDPSAAQEALTSLRRKLGADHPLVLRLDLAQSPLVRVQPPRTRP